MGFMNMSDLDISIEERKLLRDLAMKVKNSESIDRNNEVKSLWYAHNSLHGKRPLILVWPEGSWIELVPPETLKCIHPVAREWEQGLRRSLLHREVIKDDHVFGSSFGVNWSFREGNYGVDIKTSQGDNRGSIHWEAPLKNLGKDLDKLRFRKPEVDRDFTLRKLEIAIDTFGDILSVDLKVGGAYWWTCGLSATAIKLVGLEEFMLYMYDNPEGLHRLMAFLRDEQLHYIEWFEKEGFLSDNNNAAYIGSGGLGYTNELPGRERKENESVLLRDRWGFAESQETVSVSPEMFAEFVLPYQMPLMEKFGLNSYGCCEPVENRLNYILKIPRLRRISVSPWANQEKCAEIIGRDYIFSRKPNPALVGVSFNEEIIRSDLRSTLAVAGKLNLEIILKDLHTVQKEPMRLSRWVEIAREEIALCS